MKEFSNTALSPHGRDGCTPHKLPSLFIHLWLCSSLLPPNLATTIPYPGLVQGCSLVFCSCCICYFPHSLLLPSFPLANSQLLFRDQLNFSPGNVLKWENGKERDPYVCPLRNYLLLTPHSHPSKGSVRKNSCVSLLLLIQNTYVTRHRFCFIFATLTNSLTSVGCHLIHF